MARRSTWKRIALSALAVGFVTAVLAFAWDWTLASATRGSPNFTTQDDRNTSVNGYIFSLVNAYPPANIQDGDTATVTFGDGWKQSYAIQRVGTDTPSATPTGDVVEPPTITGDPTPCVSEAGWAYSGGVRGYWETTWSCQGSTCSVVSSIFKPDEAMQDTTFQSTTCPV